ncbi:hypothetical protein [Mesorhizobium sp. IMUNJ 23232]|uniref:hypothetical protein n=1 Tax=Mesorhizobium sp. IMUNJ 23232 TaxID=3376064 RepID=UPI0037A12FB2
MQNSGLLLCALLGVVPLQSVAAELTDVGTVTVPKVAPYDRDDDAFDQSHNLSGLFCPAADWCLTVADEKRGFHRLKVARGADNWPTVSYDSSLDLGEPSKNFIKAHKLKGKLKEFDLEAIASSGDKVIFIGSHANKRNSGNFNSGSHLVAIADVAALKNDNTVAAEWASLDELFNQTDMFPNALGKELQCGGLNVEGATVLGEDLLVGLRSPSRIEGGSEPAAVVISTPLDGVLKEDFSDAKLHILPTGSPFIGIRAMETVGDSLVIVTGDAGVNDLKPKKADDDERTCDTNVNKEDPTRRFQLRMWNPAKGDALDPGVLWDFDPVKDKDVEGNEVAAKLEAVAADPARSGAFFLLFDSSATVRYLSGVELK